MTWTTRTEPTATYDDRDDYLLMEDGGYLLQENGSKILLNGGGTPNWTERTTPSVTWS